MGLGKAVYRKWNTTDNSKHKTTEIIFIFVISINKYYVNLRILDHLLECAKKLHIFLV